MNNDRVISKCHWANTALISIPDNDTGTTNDLCVSQNYRACFFVVVLLTEFPDYEYILSENRALRALRPH